jgi:hypothetical protein
MANPGRKNVATISTEASLEARPKFAPRFDVGDSRRVRSSSAKRDQESQ